MRSAGTSRIILKWVVLASLVFGPTEYRKLCAEDQPTELSPKGPSSTRKVNSGHDFAGLDNADLATTEQVQGWIRELGSASVDSRESATNQLYRSGAAALATIKKAAQDSDDPEVRSRCVSLATAIEKDDLGKRVYQFLRDPDTTRTYGLEHWPMFSEIVGQGRLSKRLFKEIIDTHPSFAEDSFEDRSRLLTETERIGREILLSLRKGDETRLGDVVALMFASIRLKTNIPRDIELTTSTLTRRTPFPQEVQSTAMGTPLKALFREWIKTASSEPQMVMITCMELGIDDGKMIARKYLEDKAIGPDLYEIAMSSMMRFATTDDLPWIEPWIADQRGLKPAFRIATNIPMRQIPAPFGVPGTQRIEGIVPVDPKIEDVQVQYRDLALAVGFKVMDEDVMRHYPRAQWHPYRGYLAASLAVAVEDKTQRAAILSRWEELQKSKASEKESNPPKLTPPIEIR